MSILKLKFLDYATCKRAVELVTERIVPWKHEELTSGLFESKGLGYAIVVLGPSISDVRKERKAGHSASVISNCIVSPEVLYDHAIGSTMTMDRYGNIARSKAMQLWRDQNSDGNTDCMPHLLFADDTPYWGGVKRHGLVVACSGFQSHVDQMISGMIADALKALGRDNWKNSDDKKNGVDFLT